jgi:hypothetical protein
VSQHDEILKKEVAQYRAMRSLGLIRALGFTLVGVVGLILAATGSIFPPDDSGQPKGWLYEHLGKDGAIAASILLMAVVVLIGVIWSYRIIRDITSGYRQYEAHRRQELERPIEFR